MIYQPGQRAPSSSGTRRKPRVGKRRPKDHAAAWERIAAEWKQIRRLK